jgi:hypothetical protein
MKLSKIIISLIVLAALLAVAWYAGFSSSFKSGKTTVTHDVVLEQVKNVVKLGTVEGYFTEIYSHKDYYGPDLSFFTKKALIRVKAKILAGYDLENVKIDVDEKSRSVVISNLSEPQILSIDHDLDYYDITEGMFNSFKTSDYNRMNRQAKDYVIKMAIKSGLMENAKTQFNSHIELLRILLGNYGWELIVGEREFSAENDQQKGL